MIGKFSVCPILLAVTIFCGGKLSSLIGLIRIGHVMD